MSTGLRLPGASRHETIHRAAVPSTTLRRWIGSCLPCLLILTSSIGNAQSGPVPPPPGAETAPPPISIVSQLVVLPVNVTDAHGDFVSGLTENNFQVYEENRLQNLTVFEQEDTPVSVGLVVDHSASMKPKLASVIEAISAFAISGNSKDEMFVVDFNDNVTVKPQGEKPFTNNADELGKAAEAVVPSGRTALYDAMAKGLDHLKLGQWQKKALVVISDGGDNASLFKYSDILALARQSQVMIYSIILLDQTSDEQNPKMLQRLCKETGGIAYLPDSQRSVVDLSLFIARDLRQQYTVGFVPENRGTGNSFRRIQVRVTAPKQGKVHVRTRSGYTLASKNSGSEGLANGMR
jgi:Ca-activated chloride channel family protein